MEALAAAVPAGDLGRRCYALYEAIRPEWTGWGQKSSLDLGLIRQLTAGEREEA